MNDKIIIKGIETNNLKDISITLEKNAINLILGPSGSGKSSLAYDTVAQLGIYEYQSMFDNNVDEPTYKVKEYSNMAVAIPIKQTNYNNNIRSTIATYFGISPKINLIYSSICGLDDGFFVLNKEENTCKVCHGLGYIEQIDVDKIINYRKRIIDNPFRCWERYSDFYEKALVHFCNDNNIESDKTFNELTEKEKELLLYGNSESKYKITYKHGKSKSTRTTRYYGVLTGIPMRKNFTIQPRFYSDITCPECKGMKYSKNHLKIKVNGLSIGEMMLTPFNKLEGVIDEIKKKNPISDISEVLEYMKRFISKANDLNLGHLYFGRSIPTLSGGELQRLRLVQVFCTQLNDFIIVLDEPLAGLSGQEKERVYSNIIGLIPKHTLVVVDHSEKFINVSKKVICLGPGGGTEGGNIVDTKKYLKSQSITNIPETTKIVSKEKVNIKGDIYGYKGVSIEMACNHMNLITGPSGVGKSTLLREYLPRYFDDYVYINQKSIKGNKNSNVATALGISNMIFDMFADKYDKERGFFSNFSGKEGTCSECGGAGYKEYGGIRLICRECNGSGFGKQLNKYSVDGKTLKDIWNMSIKEAKDYFFKNNKKIYEKLELMDSLALTHVRIGQPTETLSGGENIRIKLLTVSNTLSNVIGIDEPFKGLNNTEVIKVIEYLYKLRQAGKTLLVVDHTEKVEAFFDYHMELEVDKRKNIKSKHIL